MWRCARSSRSRRWPAPGVSSVLYGVRLCDLILAKGREQIIFRATKNGEDVCAALDASTVVVLKEYLKWRGRLHDREAPLFLTPRRKALQVQWARRRRPEQDRL